MNALLNAFEVDIAIVDTVTGGHPAPASAPATAWLGGGQLTGLVYKQDLRMVTAPRILRAKVLCQACLLVGWSEIMRLRLAGVFVVCTNNKDPCQSSSDVCPP